MVLKFHRPVGALAQYVELFTFYDGYSANHSIDRLLPDGAVHIIIELDNRPKYIFDNRTLAPKQKCIRAWISGMHSHFLSISADQHASMFVIRFNPGGSFPFLHLPIHELKDQVIDAELLLGRSILSLRERLLEARHVEEKFKIVENWLLQRRESNQITEAVVDFATKAIAQAPTGQRLTSIVEKTGYSQKQFIYLFKAYVGLTPKLYQRIIRFNRVLEEIQSQRSVNWTSLSADIGYADQAHFIREFQEFSGFSPKEYLQERGELIHYLPIA